jgi:hypothetical protein
VLVTGKIDMVGVVKLVKERASPGASVVAEFEKTLVA